MTRLFIVGAFLFFLGLAGARGPNGAHWSRETVHIIRNKLRLLWADHIEIFRDFDKFNENANYAADYLYDPNDLSEPKGVCKDKEAKLCKQWTDGRRRESDLAFTVRKAIRLAFHDCFPYSDSDEGGCDGCLNLDENIHGNNGLQHTVAVLEKMYLERDFPPQPADWPQLPDSPFNMGISRADLWAFTGAVAVDESLQVTKTYCKYKPYEITCGDNSTSCYTPFPQTKYQRWGRADCTPREDAGPNQQYRAKFLEIQPKEGGNGQMTVDYFWRHFRLMGKQTTALLGAHTVGRFNPIVSRRDYSWLRSHSSRPDLFNNEYFKVLALQPQYIQEGVPHKRCAGGMDGGPARATVDAFANVFTFFKPFSDTWSTSEEPGVLSWKLHYYRGPYCDNYPEDKDTSFAEIRSLNDYVQREHPEFADGWEWCCHEKVVNNCAESAQGCPEQCDVKYNNRLRMTSPDMGLYLKWDIDDQGLPTGCGIFDNVNPHTVAKFGDIGRIRGESDCPLQDYGDGRWGRGEPLYQSVEMYAANNEQWVNDFFNVFWKMQVNGVERHWRGDQTFWIHHCCFDSGVHFDSSSARSLLIDGYRTGIRDAFECHRMCQEQTDPRCVIFQYKSEKMECHLFSGVPEASDVNLEGSFTRITGYPECSTSNCEGLRYGARNN